MFLCLSLRSFHLLLQRLPICLWPRFISSHSSPPPPPPARRQLTPQRTGVGLLCSRHSGIVYSDNTILLFSRCFFPLKDEPTQSHQQKVPQSRQTFFFKPQLARRRTFGCSR